MKKKKYTSLVLGIFSLLIAPLIFPSLCPAVENEECMECHADDTLARTKSEGMKENLFVNQENFENSVHHANDITCVDCHSDIEKLDWDNEIPHSERLAAVFCDKCHEEEAEAYVDSVHKKAGGKGITIPCYACHGYHYVTHLEAESVLERENGFCLKCHNPNKFHEWLPQMETHFAYVECTVCHAPEVPRYINLRFFDLAKQKFLDGNELLTAMGTDYDGFMPLVDTDSSGIIDIKEFENFTYMLLAKDLRGTFHAELVVAIEPVVHHVNRGAANRECEMCHIPTSLFFENVRFALNKEDGTTEHHQVDRKVLETYYLKHFYALGGTRIRLLDQIGLAMIAAGAGVVLAHLFMRILTIPTRKKKMDHKI